MIATNSAPEEIHQFNMNPRTPKRKENSIKCLFQNGNTRLYRYANKFITEFTSTKPLLLGGFTCGPVGTIVDRAFQNLISLVLVNVEILEKRNSNIAIDKELVKFPAKLHSIETDILLPRPILIRPGYVYIISIGGLPDGHVFRSDALKTSVNLDIRESNVEINIRHPKMSLGSAVGMIQGLTVNEI